MGKKLIIVESAKKANQFQKYLGSKYIVKMCAGNILDLYAGKGNIGVDYENKFKPTYVVAPDKRKIVNDLISAAKKCDEVILASDGDREGEFIAWGLARELGLDNPSRIVFHSVTKKAINSALDNPGKINLDLVRARDGRCVLDRIMGFPLSGLLQKSYHQKMSAGRVQSPALRMVVEKESEIEDFYNNGESSYYKVNGIFDIPSKKSSYEIKSQLYKKGAKKDKEKNDENDSKSKTKKSKKIDVGGDVVEEDDKEFSGGYKGAIARLGKNAKENPPKKVIKFLEKCKKSEFRVHAVFKRNSIRNPMAPFMTSTLQTDAYSKLGFGLKQTMTIAQSLYNNGYITYMRTDGVDMEKDAMKSIKKYVIKKYGEDHYRYKQYKTKNANAQEAHEAIRPTDITVKKIEGDSKEQRLYDLIWKRTVASQMAPAKIETTTAHIDISKKKKYYFVTSISKILFKGFLAVYNPDEGNDEGSSVDEKVKLPKEGDIIMMNRIDAIQDYVKPPTRFTESGLQSKMEKAGIGRPATWAACVELLQERNYVEKKNIEGKKKESYILTIKKDLKKIKEKKTKVTFGGEKNKLVPTETGKKIIKYMMKYFGNIMDYKFTADMEKKLDKISKGKKKWYKIVKEFNDELEPKIKKMEKKIKNGEFGTSKGRKLGKDPKTGKKIYARPSYKGNGYIIIKEHEDESKCRRAKLFKKQTHENITLEEALKMLKYPKKLGKYKDKDVYLHDGPSGFYIAHKDKKISINPNPEWNKKSKKPFKQFGKGKVKEESESDENKKEKKVKLLKPDDVDLDKAIELIKERKKKTKEAQKNVLMTIKGSKHNFAVRKGLNNNYIMVTNVIKEDPNKKKNFKKNNFQKAVFLQIPPNKDYEDLTEKDMEELLKKKYENPWGNKNKDDNEKPKKGFKKFKKFNKK